MFLFFKKRNRPPSFLFRRKKRSACTGSAGPQTDGRRHILRCRRSEYHSGYASLLRLVFARVRRACASAFPCKPTTQKKIICGTVTSLRSCRFRQRAAQNGRFTYEPSVFLFRAEHAGKHLFTDKSTAPQCLLFLFFKKRNRPLLFFLEEKKSSPLEEKKSFPPLVSPSHGAGVTAGAGLIVGSSCARYASTISSTDSSFRMMEISMRRLRVRPASVAFVSTGRVAP